MAPIFAFSTAHLFTIGHFSAVCACAPVRLATTGVVHWNISLARMLKEVEDK